MRTFVDIRDITDESEIDSVADEIAKMLTEKVAKHRPGGQDHEQGKHGNWSDGSSEDSGKERGAAQAAPTRNQNQGSQGMPQSPDSKPKEDPEFVRSIQEKYLSQAGSRIEHVMSVAGMEQMSHPGKKGQDTMAMYGVWDGDRFTGRYTPERTQWQADMLAQMQQEQVVKNGMEPGQDRRAIIMAGLPGAGKSHLIQTELNQYIDTREFLTINADDIKEKIIFEDAPPEIEDVGGWELSSMVHEESSHMRKLWERQAMEQGTNLILDITAANQGKTIKLLEHMSDLGYDITVVHADVTPDEAMASALRRAASGGDGEHLDRIVPPDFIRGMISTEGGDVIDYNIDDYLPHASQVMWFRPFPLNVERPPEERKPTELIWSTS